MRCVPRARRGNSLLSESVGSTAEEFEEAEVAEDLELLADFVAYVGVIGVKIRKCLFVVVDLCKSEFLFVKSFDDLQNV